MTRPFHTRAAVAVFFFALALWGLGFSGHWRIGMDSAFYVSLARRLAEGRGLGYGVPPVVPLSLAGLYRLGLWLEPGASFLGRFVYLNAFGVAAALAGLAAAYYMVREIAGGARAVVVLALVATSATYYRLSMEPLTDVPYAAVSWAAIYFLLSAQRRGGRAVSAAAALLLPLAVLTRVGGMALALAALLAYAWGAVRGAGLSRRYLRMLAVAAPGVAASVWLLHFMATTVGTWRWSYINDITNRALGQVPAQIAANAALVPQRLSVLVLGRGNLTSVGLLLLALVMCGALVRLRRRGLAVVTLYVCFYTVSMLLPNYRFSARYLLPLLPLVYLFVMDALEAAGRALAPLLPGRAHRAAVPAAAVVLSMLVAVNFAVTATDLRPRFSGEFYARYQRGFYEDYLAVSEALAERSPEGRVMARHARVIRALAGVTVSQPPYSQFSDYRPTSEEIVEFVKLRGVEMIVVDPACEESARVFRGFIESGALPWRLAGEYGRLELYELETSPEAASRGSGRSV